MASSRICSIPNCDKPAVKRGWCPMHYRRWQRHGDPMYGGKKPYGEVLRYYFETVLPYAGDDCLYWPYHRNKKGYGRMKALTAGGTTLVSRLMCEAQNGPPPTPKHEAAHSCGNGHLGCVTKRHMVWKTRAENAADMPIHRALRNAHPLLPWYSRTDTNT